MTGWDLFFTVLLVSLTLVVGWDLMDQIRDRRRARCCCGQFQIPVPYDQVHDRTLHVTHMAQRCQPCREEL